jgi:hypothetical protein
MGSGMRRFLKVDPEVMKRAAFVRKRTGKSIVSQLREIVSLRYGPGKLEPLEYYDFGLYDDTRFSPSAKREFVGKQRNREVDALLNYRQWRAIADSKLVSYALLKGLGISTPAVHAIYHGRGRPFHSVPCLRTPAEAAEFLRNVMPYPVFGKPARSHYGEGAVKIDSLDRERDRLSLAGGEEVDLESFIHSLAKFRSVRRYGYLFQELIVQHPEIERVCGACVATLRMLVLLDDNGPRLMRAMWRIPVAGAITDNFSGGASGNLAGWVNPDTGVVERVIRGLGLSESELEVHPDTGLPVRGLRLPHWDSVVSGTLDAAAALPGLQFQHWDVAIGVEGPVLVEVNYCGGNIASQAAGPRGLLTAEFLDFLEKHKIK